MGFLSKMMPTRRKAQVDLRVVANLDDIITRSSAFVLHGKSHTIEPMSVERFMKWSAALAELFALKEKKDIQTEELLDAYTHAFQSVCPSITRKDIENSSQAQLAGLYGLILDHVAGKIHTEESKKKLETVPIHPRSTES